MISKPVKIWLHIARGYQTQVNMISQEYLESNIYYDETSRTGIRWKKDIFVGKNSNRKIVVAGDVAGCLNKQTGYYQVRISRKTYKVHRLILVLFGYKITKESIVDHIDGDRCNNNVGNLRVVDRETNAKNRISVPSNTKIPYVHFSESLNRYQVSLVIKGKRSTVTFPCSQHVDSLSEAIKYLLSKEEDMLLSGYTQRQINHIKKGINEYQNNDNC